MKANIHQANWDSGNPDFIRVVLVAPANEGIGSLIGNTVYLYPKSRWGMFMDWLLKA